MASWLSLSAECRGFELKSLRAKNNQVTMDAAANDPSSMAKSDLRKKKIVPPTPFETLYKAINDFFEYYPPIDRGLLLSDLPKRWSVYPPLLLLPQTAFSSQDWKSYLDALSPDNRILFYSKVASSLKGTHLALNAPIQSTAIRSPHITPLYGDFGTTIDGPPTTTDFANAFWATTVQNGIKQTWAPLYTMFSRGNISEKTRVLLFPNVENQEIADLYIGIGYFAFSYLKAGAKRVWGWDLNAWSVEGLRRGAEMNGWRCAVNELGGLSDAQMVVFNEDNVLAEKRLGDYGVKVRHVNLGLLPSSRGAWRVATEILDEEGWIHVHGNCRDNEIESWTVSVIEEFRGLFGSTWTVEMVDRFRVKEFSPAVGHWVLDVYAKHNL